MKITIIFSVLLLRFGLAAEAQNQPTFTAAPNSPFTVGIAPLSVAAGDFNGDGHQDLVTANASSNDITVLLGNGSGGFTPAPGSPFAVGTYPGSVAVGDFNKDGHQDLAIANEGPNGGLTLNGGSITILLGNGSGGFTPAPGSPVSFGASPSFVAVGDFNGDGVQDLATVNPANDSLAVLLGNGSGGFALATSYTLLSAAVSLAVGDFNKDGHQDLVLGAGLGGVTVMLGNGSGGFMTAAGSPYAVGLNAGSVTVADFNGDGDQDIAASNGNGSSNNVTVLLGNGSGGFRTATGSPFAVGTNPASVVAADFNGDGILDLVTADEGSNNVTVLLGNGSGGFTAAAASPFVAGENPSSVASGDFNGDGVPDIATANTRGGNVTVLLGAGSGGTPAPVITQGGIVPVDSTVSTIQPGEWVSIYGTNLASSVVNWKGDFPISLGGAKVTINGKAAYLSFVSPTQINVQAPDDTATGSVPVVVTTTSGTATSAVTLAQFAPSLLLLDSKHVAGIIPRSNGSGAYGGGTYDIVGPTGSSLGYSTVAAKAGDTIELFGVGLGPTSQVVTPGRAFAGAASTTNSVSLLIKTTNVPPSFAGLSGAGLYQINVTVPVGLGAGDVSLVATVGGAQTQSGVVVSLQ